MPRSTSAGACSRGCRVHVGPFRARASYGDDFIAGFESSEPGDRCAHYRGHDRSSAVRTHAKTERAAGCVRAHSAFDRKADVSESLRIVDFVRAADPGVEEISQGNACNTFKHGLQLLFGHWALRCAEFRPKMGEDAIEWSSTPRARA